MRSQQKPIPFALRSVGAVDLVAARGILFEEGGCRFGAFHILFGEIGDILAFSEKKGERLPALGVGEIHLAQRLRWTTDTHGASPDGEDLKAIVVLKPRGTKLCDAVRDICHLQLFAKAVGRPAKKNLIRTG